MQIAIFIVLLLCLGSLWLFWYKTTTKRVLGTAPKEVPPEREDNLAKLVQLIREEREEKAKELRDKMLIENAKRRNRKGYPETIQVSQDTFRKPENLGGRDLLPYNLTEEQKELLRQFYNT